MKKARTTRDYGLAPPTIAETALTLGLTPTDFRAWIDANVAYTKQQWSNWQAKAEELGLTNQVVLPECFVRLYITQQQGRLAPSASAPAQPLASSAVAGSLQSKPPTTITEARERKSGKTRRRKRQRVDRRAAQAKAGD